jgi:hypothetical protein
MFREPRISLTTCGGTKMGKSIWLFLVTFALVFYQLGTTSIESFVNYPSWRLVGVNEFRAFHQAVGSSYIIYGVAPGLLTTILTLLLLYYRPAAIPSWAIWLAIGLQLVMWASSAAVQIPIQRQLDREGLSLPLINHLIFTNFWLRRVPTIANAILFFWMMSLQVRTYR